MKTQLTDQWINDIFEKTNVCTDFRNILKKAARNKPIPNCVFSFVNGNDHEARKLSAWIATVVEYSTRLKFEKFSIGFLLIDNYHKPIEKTFHCMVPIKSPTPDQLIQEIEDFRSSLSEEYAN